LLASCFVPRSHLHLRELWEYLDDPLQGNVRVANLEKISGFQQIKNLSLVSYSFTFEALYNGAACNCEFFSTGLLVVYATQLAQDQAREAALKLYQGFLGMKDTGGDYIWPVLSKDNADTSRWVRFGQFENPSAMWQVPTLRLSDEAEAMWKSGIDFVERSYEEIRRREGKKLPVETEPYLRALSVRERTRQTGISSNFFNVIIHPLGNPGADLLEETVQFHLSLLEVIIKRWEFRVQLSIYDDQFKVSDFVVFGTIAITILAYVQALRLIYPTETPPLTVLLLSGALALVLVVLAFTFLRGITAKWHA